MKIFNKDKMKGFLIGVCATAMIGTTGTALAAGTLERIDVVMGGLKLYVDGKLVKPTDVEGNVVEPFIYDGTTYLPLRALSNALTNNQKEVKFDSATSTIYIGEAPVAAQTDIKELKTYNDYDSAVRVGADAKFNLLDKEFAPFNKMLPNYDFVYILDSNYSALHAKMVVPYTTLGSTEEGGVTFYNVDKKGVETLIYETKATAGDDPIDVKVDLRGVNILKIKTRNSLNNYGYAILYDVTLAGAR